MATRNDIENTFKALIENEEIGPALEEFITILSGLQESVSLNVLQRASTDAQAGSGGPSTSRRNPGGNRSGPSGSGSSGSNVVAGGSDESRINPGGQSGNRSGSSGSNMVSGGSDESRINPGGQSGNRSGSSGSNGATGRRRERREGRPEHDLMNVRGNVPLTKVCDVGDRENVVMVLADSAMPQDDGLPPVFNCPDVVHASELPDLYIDAASHIVRCNNFASSIATRCAFSVGSMVNKVVAETLHVNREELVQHGSVHVIQKIESTCKKVKHDTIMRIVSACSCSKCSSLSDTWKAQDEDDASITLPYNSGDACHPTEVKLFLKAREMEGVSKTRLFQLACACEKYPKSRVFSMGVPGISHQQIYNDFFRLCSPLCASGTLPLVPHHRIAAGKSGLGLEAIHFVDGDSGYLVVDKIPSMSNYAPCGAEVAYENSSRKETWLPFRDAHHDAVEISHRFSVGSGRNVKQLDFGLSAFWKANYLVSESFEVAFTVIDDSDILEMINGARLKISIFIRRTPSSSWMPLGVELIRCGLSFLTPISLQCVGRDFHDSATYARLNNLGLYSIAPTAFVDDHLLPFQLKNVDLPFISPLGSEEIRVTTEKENVHQSMVFVAESTIPNAGHGLFLRPAPTGPMYFNRDTILCWYSDEVMVGSLLQADNTDYTVEVSLPGCTGFVDASSFNGYNLGRFANQGGLLEGLQQLALDINLGNNNFRDVEHAANQKCILKFSNGNRVATKKHVCLKTKMQVRCEHGIAQELFINYSIENYWLRFLSQNDTLEHTDDHLLKLTRWICAENNRKERPLNVQHAYNSSALHELTTTCIECPITLSVSRKRRRPA